MKRVFADRFEIFPFVSEGEGAKARSLDVTVHFDDAAGNHCSVNGFLRGEEYEPVLTLPVVPDAKERIEEKGQLRITVTIDLIVSGRSVTHEFLGGT